MQFFLGRVRFFTLTAALLWLLLGLLVLHVSAVAPVVLSETNLPAQEMHRSGDRSYSYSFDPAGSTHILRFSYRLFENERELGDRTDIIASVDAIGKGRYAVWRGTVWLTASDDTDPSTNGRRYRLRHPASVPLPLVAAVAALAAAATVLATRHLWTWAGLKESTVSSWVFLLTSALMLGVVALQPWNGVFFIESISAAYIALLVGLVVGFAGSDVRASELPPLPRVMLRYTMLIIVGWSMFSIPRFDVSAATSLHAVFTHPAAMALASLVTTFFAFFRPSFSCLPVVLVKWQDWSLTAAFDGLPVGAGADWLPLTEAILFLSCSVAVMSLLRRGLRLTGHQQHAGLAQAIEFAALIAAAAHFANYFWSGVRKVVLPGAPSWSWVTENKTELLLVNSVHLTASPTPSIPAFFVQFGGSAEVIVVSSNLLTLASQLGALPAAAIPQLAVPLLVIYDIWHFGIAALTGIFFWKWMAMNAVLIYGFKNLRFRVSAFQRAILCLFVLSAPNFFTVVALGWYDTPQLNILRIDAITRDGRNVPVPPAFWRSHSYTMMTAYAFTPAIARVGAVTSTWGTATDWSTRASAFACEMASPADVATIDSILHPGLPRFITTLHGSAVSAARSASVYPYVIFPHHVFTNLGPYAAFLALNLEDIQSYDLRLEVHCGETGVPQRNLKLMRIPVAAP